VLEGFPFMVVFLALDVRYQGTSLGTSFERQDY
jgi:hypothetical protein